MFKSIPHLKFYDSEKNGVSSLSFLQIKNSKAPISVLFHTAINQLPFSAHFRFQSISQNCSLLPLSAPSTSQKRILLPLTLLTHLQVMLQNQPHLLGLGASIYIENTFGGCCHSKLGLILPSLRKMDPQLVFVLSTVERIKSF